MSGRNLAPAISKACSLTSYLNYFNKPRSGSTLKLGEMHATFFLFS